MCPAYYGCVLAAVLSACCGLNWFKQHVTAGHQPAGAVFIPKPGAGQPTHTHCCAVQQKLTSASHVVQVARLVPFLITSLERMQPYASHPSAAAALQAAGPAAVPVLMAVLAAGDPADWPMLPHEVEGYKVVTALTRQSRQLALSALSAGAARTIYAALVKWAAVMPAPDTIPGAEPQTPDSDIQRNDLDLDPGVRYEHSKSSSSDGFSKAAVRAASPSDQAAAAGVESLVAGAAAAALQLLQTLLAAAAGAGQPGSSSRGSTSAPAAAQVKPDFHMPEDLAALLLELWHVQSLQQLAAGCLAQLQQLGLLSAAVGGHGNQETMQEAAAAATQQPGMLLSSEAAGAAAGPMIGLGTERPGVEQQAAAAAEGLFEAQESSRLLAQLKV
ncbi:hypothetical protein COO60DRAFT_1181744 [Scenedesmus sp. NREL 46B-D3]|nr:hypothetical protein COO60DRAFT_1181744 [Scenedesmus sp. NREL 46B-D3]